MYTPVQATIGSIELADGLSSLDSMLANSGILQGSPMPEMPITSAASRPYNRPEEDFSTPTKKRSFRLRLGSAQGQKFVTDDDSLSIKTPSPRGNQVIIITNEDNVKPGNVVRHGSRLVASPNDSISSSRSFSSATRSQTGPVDVDEGAFVEAEHHLKAIHEMAAEHLAYGEFEEALDVFEEILRGQKERYGPNHYRIGTALHNIGIVHLKSGNLRKAVDICEEAVKVRKQALVSNHPDVAVSLAQLGVARLECKQHRKSLVAFREALQIRRDFLGSKHPKVGKILNNVGCALYELNEMEGARLAFEEALQIQRETLRTSPGAGDDMETRTSSNSALLSIAATLCNLGAIQVRYSNFEDASVALEEALLVSGICQIRLLFVS
jgi:Tfp pilus assembly protein PilF